MDSFGGQVRTAVSSLGGSLRDSYNYLGTVLLCSVLWFAASLPVVTMGPATAAAFHVVRRAVLREDVGLGDFLTGLRRYFWRGLVVWAVLVGGMCVIVVDLMFFASVKLVALRVLTGVWIYAALFVLGVATHAFGLLVEQDTTVGKVLKRGALLVLDNPFYTGVMLLGSGLIAAACVVFTPGLMLLMAGILGFVQVNSVRGLLARYGALESPDSSES